MKQIITAIVCVIMSMCILGCASNEEKYTTLKNEFLAAKTEFYKIKPKTDVFVGKKDAPEFDRVASEETKIIEQLEPKVAEMKKLSEKDLKLTNDYQKIIESFDNMKTKLKNMKKEADWLRNYSGI